MKKLLVVLAVVSCLLFASNAFAAAKWTLESLRVDTQASTVRTVVKNTTTSLVMAVYVPDQYQKEVLAMLLSAHAQSEELYISVFSSNGKLYYKTVELVSGN